jgi:peptide subunit release factor 1 (eRF1)
MIETIGGALASVRPWSRYHCTECGAEIAVNRAEEDSPHWHNYDCPIQKAIREEQKLIDTFLKVGRDLPLLHFTVIDPREMGYSDDPEKVQALIDSIAARIDEELRKTGV